MDSRRCFGDSTTKGNLGALALVETDVVMHPRWIPRPFGDVKRVLGCGNNSFAVVHNFRCPNIPVAALKMVYTTAKSEVAFE